MENITNHMLNETKETSQELGRHLSEAYNGYLFKIPIGIITALISRTFGASTDLIFILFGLVILDIFAGFSVALKERRISSYGFGRALWKLIAYVIALFAVRLIEMAAFGGTLTFTNMAIGILSVTEGISILENTILLGVPLPSIFLDLITKQKRYKAKKKRK